MLKFNVMRWDSNSDKMVPYNIIDKYLLNDIKKERKNKHIIDYESLKDYLRKEFRFHYWCRSECEMLISGLFNKDDTLKIDIWTQIEMNLDLITELIANELKFRFTKNTRKIRDEEEDNNG